MNARTTTGSGTSDVLAYGWVREEHVEALVHSSDNFNLLLAVSLAFLGAAVAVSIALGAGAVHPGILYPMLTAAGGVGIFSGILTWREHYNVNRLRQKLSRETENYYVQSPFGPLNLSAGTNPTPRLTIGQEASVPQVTETSDHSTTDLDADSAAAPE